MRIIFRVDASIEMGTGHVMRCLTLADALTREGAECHFICREHPGHLNTFIKERGHAVHLLSYIEQHKQREHSKAEELAHASWLGATQAEDLDACVPLLKSLQPDWLIVDHYAIDERWHQELRPYCQKIMVIDDLADRQHDCDLLLDQTFGRSSEDYLPLVPQDCQVLCGAHYALLRPEFAQWRDYSLKRRAQGQLKHLLINLGGVDKDNITTEILQALANTALPDNCRITVVMGATAPWVERVQQQAALMPWPTEVKVGVNNMAELMANSDLAIGAAGATSWERCCLGLPTIMVVIAENQQTIASNLQEHGAALFIDQTDIQIDKFSCKINDAVRSLVKIQLQSSKVTSGSGTQLVSNIMLEKIKLNNASAKLRKMTSKDLEHVLAWRNFPAVRESMFSTEEITLEEHTQWFSRACKDSKINLRVLEVNGEPVGFVNIKKISAGKIAEWSFHVSPNAKKGTGYLLCSLALDYIFQELKMEKLNGEVISFNKKSIALHEKLGFRQEGVQINNYYRNGSYYDIYLFGITAVDWRLSQ